MSAVYQPGTWARSFSDVVSQYANMGKLRLESRQLDLSERAQGHAEQMNWQKIGLEQRRQAQSEQAQAFEIQTRFMEETRKQQQFDAEMPVYLTQLSLKQMEMEEAKKEAMYSFKASDYKRNGANSEIGRTLHAPAGSPAGTSAVDAVAKTTGTAKPTTGTGSIRTAKGDVVLRGGDEAWKEDKQAADEQAKLRAEGREGMRLAAERENQWGGADHYVPEGAFSGIDTTLKGVTK